MKPYVPPTLEHVLVLPNDILTASKLSDLFVPEGEEIDRVTW